MRIRRISKHLKDQNWLAVFLDFGIVVAGVFLGIQLGNWNEVRQVKSALSQAEIRLVSEHKANIKLIDNFVESTDRRLTVARSALDALRVCDSTEDGYRAINAGLNAIRGTGTLKFRQTALSTITGNNSFLMLMPEAKREDIVELSRRLNQAQTTLDWLESRPFVNHIEDYPGIVQGELTAFPSDKTAMVRSLELGSSVEDICKDRELLGKFYLWERTATFQILRARQIGQWLSDKTK